VSTFNGGTGAVTGVSTYNGVTGPVTGVSSFNGSTGTIVGVSSVNGSTGAITGIATTANTVSSFNGSTGAVTGVSSYNSTTGAVTGVSTYNGATGPVTGVATFNGATGAVTGVSSVNGGTGAITSVALTTGNLSQFAATTSAQFNGVISDEIGTGNVILSDLATSAQTASYTLVLTDKGKLVEMSVATANNLTVPPNSSVAFPTGSQINIVQTGAGQTTVVAGSGVTVNATPGLKLRAQWSSATLIKRATDTWVLVGDVSA
jgi:hypothetical protein